MYFPVDDEIFTFCTGLKKNSFLTRLPLKTDVEPLTKHKKYPINYL